MDAPLDLAHVRRSFPGLSDDLAFLENAGGSLPCGPVLERVRAYLEDRMVQLGATYPRSVASTAAVEAGRAAAARLAGATPDEVLLNGSTTMNLYVMARALAPRFAPGDEIVVTDLDHEANVGAWRRLAEERGLTVREWAVDPASHALTEEGLGAVLSERTRLVAFTHCSNVVGTLHDVPRLAARAKEAGALVCVDGVAHAPHRRVDVRALGVDLYAFSFYKVYGPHVGCLFVRREVLDEARSQNHFFLGPEEGPYRFEPGNVNHELVAGLPGIVAYLEGVAAAHGDEGDPLEAAFARFAAHEERLSERVLQDLRDHPRVRLFGERSADRAKRVPTITFTLDGVRSRDVVARADEAGLAIRHGHFYARRAMDAFGLPDPEDGVVRASFVHYNRLEEADRLRALLATFL